MALQTSQDTTARLNAEALHGTVFIADNLPFLKALDTESIDLVCIDPPFGKKQTFTGNLKPPLSKDEQRIEQELMESWGVNDPDSAYELGLEYPDQAGTTASFQDIWNFRVRVSKDWLDALEGVNPAAWWLIQSTRYTHGDSHASYIAFMVERMIEIRRILKPTGSVYLHCDHDANAYLRQMMDAVFSPDNFRNEIVWSYRTGGVSKKYWPRKHDTLLFYVKSNSYSHNPLQERVQYDRPFFTTQIDPKGDYYADVYVRDVWDNIKPLINVSGERTGYPTQKPQALAKRIIEASSNPGDIVLDCFAGCAYVPVAAELTGRKWIACDMSPRAWTIIRRQFHKHPDLGILTEGELASEGIETRLEHADRVIRVRGPQNLPTRTTPDAPEPMRLSTLPEPEFRQRPHETSDEIWQAFVDEWGTRCWYCGTDKPANRRELQLDHIEPNKRDGTNDDCFNRALACAPCNGDKSDRLSIEETINLALEVGRIATPALRYEALTGFHARHEWAKDRWERIKPNRMDI